MPNWTKEQELAIYKDNSNIIVSAGAGSGKTAVLTARVIRKLKDGQGNYLLNQVFDKAWDYELLGKPVKCSENATALGTASKPVIFYGDFSGLAVKEAEEIEISVLKELYAAQHAIGVCGYAELDAKVENLQKIAVAVSGSAD